MSADAPRPWSLRFPALRGLGVLIISLLLPFEWVVEVDGCNQAPEVKRFTGAQLAGHFEADVAPWVVLALAVMVAMPLLAARLRPRWAMVAHLLGAAATGFSAWVAWIAVFFTLFAERTLRPAGLAGVVVVVLCVVDGAARPVLAVREWWKARLPR